ncbi:MAG: zinc-ribbon domain containing protein [Firmicutes bacterium]|nr:zinc-ribbon domain containing protein [Bacillota bacterium]
MYEDKTLTCRDCGREFTFTASEQEFFASKGFENEPSRCPECRAARKQQSRDSRGFDRRPREMYTATCARCGKPAEVPFRPSADKPVYCRDCYQPKAARW